MINMFLLGLGRMDVNIFGCGVFKGCPASRMLSGRNNWCSGICNATGAKTWHCTKGEIQGEVAWVTKS